jgi:phage-related protein
MNRQERDVIWLGDSLSVLQQFPKSVRVDLGSDLRRLQIGELPLDSKPVKTVGPGVRELRAKDRDNQFRTIYVIPKGDDIIVLHTFIKKSRTTAKTRHQPCKGAIKEFQPELRNGVCNDGNQNYPR